MKLNQTPYVILIIEDNMGDYVLIEDYLLEYLATPEILHAHNFSDAKKMLQEHYDRIDTVFLDLSLPDKSGEALIEEVLGMARRQPVIVLTGYTDASFAVKSLTLGASDYLLKDDMNAVALYKSLIYNMERKKSVMRLQESERRYSDLFHLSPQPMWLFEQDSLRFLDVNEAAINHYGYTKEEFFSMTIEDIRPKEYLKELHDLIKHSRENNINFSKAITTHQTKSGRKIKVEVLTKQIDFKDKAARLVLSGDITEKLEYISAIEEQNKKLREIAWIQSHVVRAPLARIMGLVGFLKDEVLTEEERNEILTHIQTSASEMDDIVKDIIKKTQHINLALSEDTEKDESA